MTLRITETSGETSTSTNPVPTPGTLTFTQSGKAIPGPQGPPGPQGETGHIQWAGEGPPPEVIVGAKAGHTYLDRTTGKIYKLNG